MKKKSFTFGGSKLRCGHGIGCAQKTAWNKCRKKPVVVQFREVIPNFVSLLASNPEVLQWGNFTYSKPEDLDCERIQTREGVLLAFPERDFVIKGIEGELYPITKTTFYKTYEVLEK